MCEYSDWTSWTRTPRQAARARHSAASATRSQGRRAPSGIPGRVQCDAVAFAVVDHGAAAVRADRVHRLHDLAAVALDLVDGVADPAIDVHVDEDAAARDNCRGLPDEAPAVAILVVEHTELHRIEFFLVHPDGQYRRVERSRAIEIGHRDV